MKAAPSKKAKLEAIVAELEAETIFDKLDTLVEEKSIVIKALQQSEAKLAYFERRRPKLYQLAIQRFIKDAELTLNLKEIFLRTGFNHIFFYLNFGLIFLPPLLPRPQRVSFRSVFF